MKRPRKASGFHYFLWTLELKKLILIYLAAPTNMNGKSSWMGCTVFYVFNSGNLYSVPNRFVPSFFSERILGMLKNSCYFTKKSQPHGH